MTISTQYSLSSVHHGHRQGAALRTRWFQAGKAKAIPKRTDGIVESIRLLRVARNSAVKSRSAALVSFRDLLIAAPQELRDQLSCRKTLRGKVTVCARIRPSDRNRPEHWASSSGSSTGSAARLATCSTPSPRSASAGSRSARCATRSTPPPRLASSSSTCSSPAATTAPCGSGTWPADASHTPSTSPTHPAGRNRYGSSAS